MIAKLRAVSAHKVGLLQSEFGLFSLGQTVRQGRRESTVRAGTEPRVRCSVILHDLRALAAADREPVQR